MTLLNLWHFLFMWGNLLDYLRKEMHSPCNLLRTTSISAMLLQWEEMGIVNNQNRKSTYPKTPYNSKITDAELSNQNINNQANSGKHWRHLQRQGELWIFEKLLEVDWFSKRYSRAVIDGGVDDSTWHWKSSKLWTTESHGECLKRDRWMKENNA